MLWKPISKAEITHVFKLDKVAEAMRVADSKNELVVKVVIDCT